MTVMSALYMVSSPLFQFTIYFLRKLKARVEDSLLGVVRLVFGAKMSYVGPQGISHTFSKVSPILEAGIILLRAAGLCKI